MSVRVCMHECRERENENNINEERDIYPWPHKLCLPHETGVAAQLLSWGPQLNTLRLKLEVKSASWTDPVPSPPGSSSCATSLNGTQAVPGKGACGREPGCPLLPFCAPSHHEWGWGGKLPLTFPGPGGGITWSPPPPELIGLRLCC